MIIRNIPLRHELKYFITPAELNVLRSSLKSVMQLDPNGNENNEYHIRSLYFDTINDDALEEKIAGVGNRKNTASASTISATASSSWNVRANTAI